MSTQEITSFITVFITVVSFLGGIATFLFKKIAIEPLQRTISTLTDTLKEFKLSTDKRLDLHDDEIDFLKDKSARYEEQIKTLFSYKEAN